MRDMERIIDWLQNTNGETVDEDVQRILQSMFPDVDISALSSRTIYSLCTNLYYRLCPRTRLTGYTHLNHAVDLIRKSKNILVITGAGVSVSCGIPDFRSANGIYARLHKDFPSLPNPQAMFDIDFFRSNPVPFFDFAQELYPGRFKPSISHHFIKILEEEGKLLRNYTQNIDTLETVAGIKNVIECHGSFKTATCASCKNMVGCDDIRDDVLSKKVPICTKCSTGVVKPDIVFFGEDLPSEFYEKIEGDKLTADLLIIMGSSMKVQPVGTIPRMVPKNVPQILINREPLSSMSSVNADICLLGDCDVIVKQLCFMLGGSFSQRMNTELKSRAPEDQSVEMTSLEPADTELLHNLATESLDVEQLENLEKLEAVTVCHDGPSSAKRVKVTNDSDLILSVGEILENHYFHDPPNVTAFKGADVLYDLQRKEVIVCRSMTSTLSSTSAPSSSEDDDSEDEAYDGRRTKSFSLDGQRINDTDESDEVRPSSAPADLCEGDMTEPSTAPADINMDHTESPEPAL